MKIANLKGEVLDLEIKDTLHVGRLVVHRQLDGVDPRSQVQYVAGRWTLTHEPTGSALALGLASKTVASKLASIIAALPCPWATDSISELRKARDTPGMKCAAHVCRTAVRDQRVMTVRETKAWLAALVNAEFVRAKDGRG